MKIVIRTSLIFVSSLCALILGIFSCQKTKTMALEFTNSEQKTFIVAIKPQVWFLKQLLDKGTAIEYIIPSNIDPEDYQPTFKDIAKLEHARSFFWILGNTNEKRLTSMIKDSFPTIPIFSMEKDIDHLLKEDGDQQSYVGNQEHLLVDPHIWLSPSLAQDILLNTKEALIQILDLKAEGLQQLEQRYLKALDKLDIWGKELAHALQPFQGKNVYTYHPEFAYFCQEFTLTQIALEKQNGSNSVAQFRRFVENIQTGKIKSIIAMYSVVDNAQVKEFAALYQVKILYGDPYQHSSSYEESLFNLKDVLLEHLSPPI